MKRLFCFLVLISCIDSRANSGSGEEIGTKQCVVLLHGLVRSSGAMEKLGSNLTKAGFHVANVNYPSRKMDVEKLAELAVTAGFEQCESNNSDQRPIHFITHSLGGILVRQYFTEHDPARVGRVVMLGPPNQGSEVVDHFRGVPGFKWLNGPAGLQLGTGVGSIVKNLGAVKFDLGIIAGNRTVNPILSQFLPKPNDGKVSVQSAKVDGMNDFLVLPVNHTFMMNDDEVIRESLLFLDQGAFEHGLQAKNVVTHPKARN